MRRCWPLAAGVCCKSARNTQNFELLKIVGRQRTIGCCSSAVGITLTESLRRQYLASEGSRKVVFGLRGIEINQPIRTAALSITLVCQLSNG